MPRHEQEIPSRALQSQSFPIQFSIKEAAPLEGDAQLYPGLDGATSAPNSSLEKSIGGAVDVESIISSLHARKLDLGLELVECRDSICQIMRERVSEVGNVDIEDSFSVGDMGEVIRQLQRWKALLPRIEPFYAVKCNTDEMVLNTLVSLGIGFDCASKAEIATMLSKGVHSSSIIFANPCKQSSHIKYARSRGVSRMTFDNAEELYKIKECYPDAELVLRIVTDDSHSVCRFSVKFGASLDITKSLLELGKELGLNIIGVSFHVGSGCYDAMSFRAAVVAARKVFDEAEEVGYSFSLLDVGGGFPGNHTIAISFEEIAYVLRDAVDELFPPHIRVIAEPGRFFVASAFTLAVNVTSRRTVCGKDPSSSSYMYYVNDGVYGSFNCILFDHAEVTPKVLTKDGEFYFDRVDHKDQQYSCSVWGPTCDSMDCITKQGSLPALDVGDWLYFENMGAYTMAAASTFNGFKPPTVLYTDTSR